VNLQTKRLAVEVGLLDDWYAVIGLQALTDNVHDPHYADPYIMNKVRTMQTEQTHQAIEGWTRLLKTSVDESSQVAQAWQKTAVDSSNKMMEMFKTDWMSV